MFWSFGDRLLRPDRSRNASGNAAGTHASSRSVGYHRARQPERDLKTLPERSRNASLSGLGHSYPEVSQVFTPDRFIPHFVGRPRRARDLRPAPPRRRLAGGHFERVRAGLPALCAIGIAAALGWMVAGGTLPSIEMPFGRPDPAMVAGSRGTPVHVDSSPAGAQVRIDGKGFGETPLDTRLSPGRHTLSLQHPDALDDDQILQVADTGAGVDVGLWRRRPDVVPLRPVYPGAPLLDARFLDDGQIALLVGIPSQVHGPYTGRELWRLDPATGHLSRVDMPETEMSVPRMVLSPDGDQVAYVTPSSSPSVTVTGWTTGSSGATPGSQQSDAESVWLAPLDGSQQPRRIFELPSSSPLATVRPEHAVDLVWTPDGTRLVVISRQTGPPVRARVFLLDVGSGVDGNSHPAATELVLLPAEVVPDSAVPDPRGRWLALVTRAAVAPGGNNLLNLCVLELQPAGMFRNVADLGPGGSPPVSAPVAWPPAAEPDARDRLIFVGSAPAASLGAGPFGIFGALRPSAPPSGMFMADLEASGLQGSQPRRLGATINNFGLVWRFETTLYGFARQDDGSLTLHSIDPTSGAVHDLGVRLLAGAAQSGAGLSVRWDTRHGYALLLAHAPVGAAAEASGDGGPLQAWLVSFVSSRAQPGLTH